MRGLRPSPKTMISFHGNQSSSFLEGHINFVISIVAALIIFYVIVFRLILGVLGGLFLLLIICPFSTGRILKSAVFGGHEEGYYKWEDSQIRDDQPTALSGKPSCSSEQPTSQRQDLGTIPSLFNDFTVFGVEELVAATEIGTIPSLFNDFTVFGVEELVAATENFHDNNKLGHGGFSAVYKGTISQGIEIAVKKLFKSNRGKEEFLNEVKLVAKVQHRNLVKLIGCCAEGSERLIVYEYLPNNSLHTFLFDPSKSRLLDWQKRYNIILGVNRGLLYLHEDSHLRIIHRDIKAGNILLDTKFNPKIADFGIARHIIDEDESHVRTRPAGTRGYMAPEYCMEGKLSVKADVYSFGILVLELISGRKSVDFNLEREMQILLDWARGLNERGNLVDMIDPVIIETCRDQQKQALRCIHVALSCTQTEASHRPSMSTVNYMLMDPQKLDFVGTINDTKSTSNYGASILTDDTIVSMNNSAPSHPSSVSPAASTHAPLLPPSDADDSTTSFVPRTYMPEKSKFGRLKFWKVKFWRADKEKKRLDFHSQTQHPHPGTILSPSSVFTIFEMKTLVDATSNFRHKVGEGDFGSVYRGITPDGSEIAVNKMCRHYSQGRNEFVNEVQLMAEIRHPNLVKIIGCCAERSPFSLVYEYLPNMRLDRILYPVDPNKRRHLDWQKRYSIILGVTRGLLYLHENSHIQITHGEIKPFNILLDEKLNPKIADFGVAKLFPEDQTHVTFPYKSRTVDVYSFGILVLELMSGTENMDFTLPNEMQCLFDWAWRLYKRGNTMDMIDPVIIETCSDQEQAFRCIHVALLCIQLNASLRPSMSTINLMLSAMAMTLPDPTKPHYAHFEATRDIQSSSNSGSSVSSAPYWTNVPLSNADVSITDLVMLG